MLALVAIIDDPEHQITEGIFAVSRQNWRLLRGIDRGRLKEARLQAHYAGQWLGRVGSAFVPPQPDYSHTSMNWNEALVALVTNALKDEARLGLRIADLTLVMFTKENEQASSYPLHGRSNTDLRRWLDHEINARGMEAHALDKTSPYEIPAHAIAKGASYSSSGISDGLLELAAWFANAHHLLNEIRQQMIGRSMLASPVRCWPHHFDLATLILIDVSGGENARSVNAGLSPGDEFYDEPYFYVSPYPYSAPTALPRLSKLGHWHTQGFTAAIAPATRILEANDQKAETDAFLRNAIEGSIKVLS